MFKFPVVKFSKSALFERATRFCLLERDPLLGNDEIYIDKKQQQDGSYKYAISNGSSVLTKEGDFEFEPSPSSRDEKYLKRARYASVEEAWTFWTNWVNTQLKLSPEKQSPYFRDLYRRLTWNPPKK